MTDVPEAIAFIRAHHRAVLATTAPSGRVQLTPVLVAADEDGTLLMSTRETAVKAKNIARTGRAAFVVMQDAFFGPFVQVEGAATVTAMPDALPALEQYYRLISGEHGDWGEYRAAMERERRVAVRVTVDHAGPTVSG